MLLPSNPVARINFVMIGVLLFVAVTSLSYGEDFVADYSDPGLQQITNVLVTTELDFVINGVPANSKTVWEVSHWEQQWCGEGMCSVRVFDYSEEDSSGSTATSPSLSFVSGPHSYTFEAVITPEGEDSAEFTWRVGGAAPDPAISVLSIEPAEPVTGEPLYLRVGIQNHGNLPTDTAPGQQELHYYLNNKFLGSIEYSPLASGEYRTPYYLIPIGSIAKPGAYKVRVIADATNIIDTAFPFIADDYPYTLENNEQSYTFFVHGLDWLKVPKITGQYAHADPLATKPFKVVEIRRSRDVAPSHPSYYPIVVGQVPAFGSWVAPTDTGMIAIAAGRSLCNASILSPHRDARWARGSLQTIRWQSESIGECHCDFVRIRLMKDGNEIAIIADSTANNGEYTWRIKKKKFEPGKYQIRIDSVDDAVSFIVQSFSLTRN